MKICASKAELIWLVASESCWCGQKTRHYKETFKRQVWQDNTSLVPGIQV